MYWKLVPTDVINHGLGGTFNIQFQCSGKTNSFQQFICRHPFEKIPLTLGIALNILFITWNEKSE